MAATLKTLTQSRVANCARPSRQSVVVRASQETSSRRALLGFVATAVASLAVAQQASAIRLPSQDFTGGLVRGGGNSPKSPTAASMEGYTLEGTKKGGISAKQRRNLLAAARKEATELATKS